MKALTSCSLEGITVVRFFCDKSVKSTDFDWPFVRGSPGIVGLTSPQMKLWPASVEFPRGALTTTTHKKADILAREPNWHHGEVNR